MSVNNSKELKYDMLEEYVCWTCDRYTFIYVNSLAPARCASCGQDTVEHTDTKHIDMYGYKAGAVAEHHSLTGQYRFIL